MIKRKLYIGGILQKTRNTKEESNGATALTQDSNNDNDSDHGNHSDDDTDGTESFGTKCAKCNRDEEGNMVYCDFCEGWFHIECEKLDIPTYKAIKKTDSINNILYRCCRCGTGWLNTRQQNEMLTTQFGNLAETMNAKIAELTSAMNEMRHAVTELQNNSGILARKIVEN